VAYGPRLVCFSRSDTSIRAASPIIPADANSDQADLNSDGLGDACDICPNDPDNDADGDGICGDVDNCPDTVADVPWEELGTSR